MLGDLENCVSEGLDRFLWESVELLPDSDRLMHFWHDVMNSKVSEGVPNHLLLCC